MKRTLQVLLALLILHAVSVVGEVRCVLGGATYFETWLRFSPDMLMLVGLGWLATLRLGYRSLVTHALSLAFLLLLAYRLGYSLMPTFFGKPFQIYHDALRVPALVHLLSHDQPTWMQALQVIVTLSVLAAIYVLLFAMVQLVLRTGSGRETAIGGLVAIQIILIAVWAESTVVPQQPSRILGSSMVRDAVSSGWTLLRTGDWRIGARFGDRVKAAKLRMRQTPTNLGRLGGADVYVIFVESYGRALFRKPELAQAFAGWTPKLEGKLAKAGFEVCSSHAYPSIVGCASSLAHGELLSGVEVWSDRAFELLLRSELQPLPRLFTEAGYRAFNVHPAVDVDSWSQGAFYGFTEDVFRNKLPYDGHTYHWGKMPDQFALNHVLRTRVADAPRPVFVHYVSVISHGPFRWRPPYYEDWTKVARPGAFDDPEHDWGIGWVSYARHPDVLNAYMDMLHYSLRTVVGLCEQLERPSLVIVLGDHQPPIAGLLESSETRDVPVHVFSNRKELLAPFRKRGFVDGLTPATNGVGFSFAEFLYRFLEDFSDR